MLRRASESGEAVRPCPNHDMNRCLVLMSWISETDIGGGDGGGGGGPPARLAAVRAMRSRCLERVLWMSRVRSLVAMVLQWSKGTEGMLNLARILLLNNMLICAFTQPANINIRI